MNLYIKIDKPVTNVTELIQQLYTCREGLPGYWAEPTYLDKECTRIECLGKRRSFEDLLAIAQTYFPNTTEPELMSVLKDLKFGFLFCSDIHKYVFQGYGDNITPDNITYWNSRNAMNRGKYSTYDLIEIYNQIQ